MPTTPRLLQSPPTLARSLPRAASSLSFAFANSGKVSGKVIDSKTGDTLAGVNVFLEGTSYGAATNEFGEYVIINIPPGNYSIKASYKIGQKWF